MSEARADRIERQLHACATPQRPPPSESPNPLFGGLRQTVRLESTLLLFQSELRLSILGTGKQRTFL